MGDRGDGAHGQWGPWAIGTFWPITSLLLDGFLQKFSHIQLKPPQPAQGYFSSEHQVSSSWMMIYFDVSNKKRAEKVGKSMPGKSMPAMF